MKKLFVFSLLLAGLAVACKKESTDPEPVKTTINNNNNNDSIPPDTMEKVIEIKTDFGSLYMWLYKGTPLHRANFLKLADSGFFDGTTFHRCVPNFVIQGGDPNSKDSDSTNDGKGGPGYKIPAEINTTLFKHIYGAVGAARDNNPAKESNGSQFYIVLPQAGYPGLNGNYTVFGLILKGMEVADSIVKQPQNASNRPYTNIAMDVNVVEKSRAVLRNDFQFESFEK